MSPSNLTSRMSSVTRELHVLLSVAFSWGLCRCNASAIHLSEIRDGEFSAAIRKEAIDAVESFGDDFGYEIAAKIDRVRSRASQGWSLRLTVEEQQAKFVMDFVYAALDQEDFWKTEVGTLRRSKWNVLGLPFEEGLALAGIIVWHRSIASQKDFRDALAA